jgi:hypothetical protein
MRDKIQKPLGRLAAKREAGQRLDGYSKFTVPARPCQALTHYNIALHNIPAPGAGCHPYLLTVANLGTFANLDPEQIYNDIRQAIPTGGRCVPDNEIFKTVQKARRDYKGGTFTPQPRPKTVIQNGKAALQKIIDQAQIEDPVDLWEASPLRLLDDPAADAILLLKTLFKTDDLIFIGDRHDRGIVGKTIRTTADWIDYYQGGGATAPFIIINPLSGESAPTKGGDKETLRGDLCIKDFRYCLIEFDNLNHEDQIKFWSAVKLPIVTLIDSGGKSIHGWIDVKQLSQVTTAGEWETEIKGRLYDRILRPLGVDTTCSNPARLSRLPGHWRDKGAKAIQRILWLSPEGRPVAC